LSIPLHYDRSCCPGSYPSVPAQGSPRHLDLPVLTCPLFAVPARISPRRIDRPKQNWSAAARPATATTAHDIRTLAAFRELASSRTETTHQCAPVRPIACRPCANRDDTPNVLSKPHFTASLSSATFLARVGTSLHCAVLPVSSSTFLPLVHLLQSIRPQPRSDYLVRTLTCM
jgi:hypothetical protein